ncbi:hypothetical protein GGX14DRAFT_544988 [Mycena pura]|uniref:Uncharacterized protein n=1 Tax=Mycena pura TaxID=153505 RepID=A0AAD6V0R2_9AGAR|nr:hypothetical protein GGX14DRAFT_544988 [Mycena pura]
MDEADKFSLTTSRHVLLCTTLRPLLQHPLTDMEQPTSRSNNSRAFKSSLLSFEDYTRGKELEEGWTKYTPPHQDFEYFYHAGHQLVTDRDISDPEKRRHFLATYRPIATRNHPNETFVQGDTVAVVDHEMKSLTRGMNTADQSKASYWTYLHVYPCHHKLPDNAEKEAIHILHLATALNLTNEKEIAPTPFSLQEIQSYVDFFNFSRDICTPCDDKRIVKAIIIIVIIANFSSNMGIISKSDKTRAGSCERNFWSSVAFLAVPNLVDVAQFFIILSTALSLGCVLMGFNTGVDESLSQIQRIPALRHKFHLTPMLVSRKLLPWLI